TLKSPSYTKSVSWQHYQLNVQRKRIDINKNKFVF
ncbi:transposase, partial [Shigella boydii]